MKGKQMKNVFLIIALLTTACGGSVQMTAATTTSGHSYPICFEAIEPITIVKARVLALGCSTVEAVVEDMEKQAKLLYPKATIRRVQQKLATK
jgi:hypothetical protein